MGVPKPRFASQLGVFLVVLLAGQLEVLFGMSEVRKSSARMVIVANPKEDIRKLIAEQLRDCGWNVISVDSCGRLYKRMQAWPGAQVILNTEMPDESGFLACSKCLKSQPTTQIHLVDDQADEVNQSLATFVGAANFGTMEKVLGDFIGQAKTRI